MVYKIMITSAVPFHMARLQSAVSRNIRTATQMNVYEQECSNPDEPPRERKRKLSEAEKLHIRRQRNITSARVSRNRIQEQKDILEKKLSELQYEKMKLLLENESLQKENVKLGEENVNLNFKIQNLNNNPKNEENAQVEAAFKHAWFVSISQLKKWVFPELFLILMISTSQVLKNNLLIQTCCIPHLNLQETFSSYTKFLFHLACLPWKSMIFYPQPLIVNG